MKIVNTNKMEEMEWTSPTGKFQGFGKQVSEALGRDPKSTDLMLRHPFDVEVQRLPPGKIPYPFHSHSAQWEFYWVMSGTGQVRHGEGVEQIAAGDAFVFKPGEAHTFYNNGDVDLVMMCIADNPIGESCYYPDSGKWAVRSPQRAIIRSEPLDYFDGEE